jgi:hypothetical protein
LRLERAAIALDGRDHQHAGDQSPCESLSRIRQAGVRELKRPPETVCLLTPSTNWRNRDAR